jgi:hypothetical protein
VQQEGCGARFSHKEWGKEGGFSGVTKEAEVVEQEVPIFELDSYESIPFVAV